MPRMVTHRYYCTLCQGSMGFAFEYVLLVGAALRSLSLVGAPKPGMGAAMLSAADRLLSACKDTVDHESFSPRVINYLKKQIE